MSSDVPPAGPPPSYLDATSTGGSTAIPANQSSRSHLDVPQAKNNIPVATRRSMEDEVRPLPKGWVRQWDSKEKHQFFVDTTTTPPRSMWHHPYDDEAYLKTLSSAEREKIQEESNMLAKHKDHDLDSLEEYPHYSRPNQQGQQSSSAAELPPRPSAQRQGSTSGPKGLIKLKDKLTGTTHEERARKRAQRDEEERQYYVAQQKFRDCMDQAMQTGQPVFYGKDKDGKDVYIEPPGGPGAAGYGGGYGQQQGRPGAYGVNPYAHGPYGDPNARFIRPSMPYQRPYGYGYGGGMYPGGMGMPMMGGLMGGMLLGGLMF